MKVLIIPNKLNWSSNLALSRRSLSENLVVLARLCMTERHVFLMSTDVRKKWYGQCFVPLRSKDGTV